MELSITGSWIWVKFENFGRGRVKPLKNKFTVTVEGGQTSRGRTVEGLGPPHKPTDFRLTGMQSEHSVGCFCQNVKLISLQIMQ